MVDYAESSVSVEAIDFSDSARDVEAIHQLVLLHPSGDGSILKQSASKIPRLSFSLFNNLAAFQHDVRQISVDRQTGQVR